MPSWSTWSIHYFLACTAIMSSIAALQYAYGSMKTRSSTARKGTRSSSKKAEEMTPEFKAFRERESSRVYGARVSAMVNVRVVFAKFVGDGRTAHAPQCVGISVPTSSIVLLTSRRVSQTLASAPKSPLRETCAMDTGRTRREKSCDRREKCDVKSVCCCGLHSEGQLLDSVPHHHAG